MASTFPEQAPDRPAPDHGLAGARSWRKALLVAGLFCCTVGQGLAYSGYLQREREARAAQTVAGC